MGPRQPLTPTFGGWWAALKHPSVRNTLPPSLLAQG